MEVGDNITYILATNVCKNCSVLLTYIDPRLDMKNCITEIDLSRLVIRGPMQHFEAYRFTPSDFWMKTFDLRKKIWSE